MLGGWGVFCQFPLNKLSGITTSGKFSHKGTQAAAPPGKEVDPGFVLLTIPCYARIEQHYRLVSEPTLPVAVVPKSNYSTIPYDGYHPR